jgi:hypothetical protein
LASGRAIFSGSGFRLVQALSADGRGWFRTSDSLACEAVVSQARMGVVPRTRMCAMCVDVRGWVR